jgi:hypothetical protein
MSPVSDVGQRAGMTAARFHRRSRLFSLFTNEEVCSSSPRPKACCPWLGEVEHLDGSVRAQLSRGPRARDCGIPLTLEN